MQVISIKTFILVAGFCLVISNANAAGFGTNGKTGEQGFNGRSGKDGLPLVFKADGTARTFDLSGGHGEDGGPGQSGKNATQCTPPHRPSNNLTGADGGVGGSGGSGGRGGNGGNVTIYFSEIGDLSTLLIKGVPGRAGRGNWGGRGGDGCRCQEYSWTVGEAADQKTYTCANGERGDDGTRGVDGAGGSYGRVTLISQLDPIPTEKPEIELPFSKMLGTVYHVSKNLWEVRSGTNQLFSFGTELSNQYQLYKGSVSADVEFVWEAAAPYENFKNQYLLLASTEGGPKVSFSNSLWIDSQWMDAEEGHKKFVFKAVIPSQSVTNLTYSKAGGVGDEHFIEFKDSAGVSDIIATSMSIKYYVVENGSYRLKFEGPVPRDAMDITAKIVTLNLANAGVDPSILANGNRVLIEATIQRSLGQNTRRYNQSQSYVIRPDFKIGSTIEVLRDANMLSGNVIVAKVKKGEQYVIEKTQDGWLGLKTQAGVQVKGWLNMDYAKPLQ